MPKHQNQKTKKISTKQNMIKTTHQTQRHPQKICNKLTNKLITLHHNPWTFAVLRKKIKRPPLHTLPPTEPGKQKTPLNGTPPIAGAGGRSRRPAGHPGALDDCGSYLAELSGWAWESWDEVFFLRDFFLRDFFSEGFFGFFFC